MKAKEYAKLFFDELSDGDTKSAIKCSAKIMELFIRESADIAKQRGVKTDSGFVSVIKEQSDKWRLFATIVNQRLPGISIRTDAFIACSLIIAPELNGKLLK